MPNYTGGTGDDTYAGGDEDDWLFGGDGNDTLSGNGGHDFIRGDAGDDSLYGGDGNDYFRGGTGVDYFDGGADDGSTDVGFGIGDRISFYERGATAGVIIDLRTGVISNDGFGNVESFVGIESIGGGTAFADQFYGSDVANLILGGVGDTIMSFGGDDRFQMEGVAAVLDGGAGIDWRCSRPIRCCPTAMETASPSLDAQRQA